MSIMEKMSTLLNEMIHILQRLLLKKRPIVHHKLLEVNINLSQGQGILKTLINSYQQSKN